MGWSTRLADPRHPLQLVAGLVLWAAWFVVMYAGLSLGCAVTLSAAEDAATWLNGVLLLLTLLVTAVLLGGALRCRRASGEAMAQRAFVARVAGGIYLFSAVATLLVGLPVVVLPPCL